MYFQNVIIQELRRLKNLYRHIDINGLKPNAFHREFLVGLRERTRLFKPTYACSTCRVEMTKPPVSCSVLSNLAAKLQDLLGIENGEEECNRSPPCNMADYFIFFTRHPF